jgi:UDP-N-acetylmuramoylalanine--D-glutamate ligase
MKLADLAGRRIVVLGVGIDVAAALPRVVAAQPRSLVVVDADPARARAALAAAGLPAGGADLDVLDDLATAPGADVAIRSPGFSPYQPEVKRRIDAGMTTVTPLGLWLCERGDRPAVAVTGTKGKSSTSVLAQLALERLGHPSRLLGNIGVPPWTTDPDTRELVVLEISSYQAADLPLTAPVAVLTALGEDHVGWHGSVEQYLLDKARVFRAPTPSGDRWCGAPAGLALPPAFDGIDFRPVDVPPGDLRASNARVAAAAALAATGGDEAGVASLAADLLDAYPDLPGRFSTVARHGEVEWIDDALASNPLGLAAAVASVGARPVVVIVGGGDRGASIEPVVAALANRRQPTTVVCIDDAASLADRYRAAGATAVVAPDLEAAVAEAAALAERGGVVLFSPGMPTPEAQGTWADRSARFRRAIEGRQLS